MFKIIKNLKFLSIKRKNLSINTKNAKSKNGIFENAPVFRNIQQNKNINLHLARFLAPKTFRNSMNFLGTSLTLNFQSVLGTFFVLRWVLISVRPLQKINRISNKEVYVVSWKETDIKFVGIVKKPVFICVNHLDASAETYNLSHYSAFHHRKLV